MTESEWLACQDPAPMLRHVLSIPDGGHAPRTVVSERKLRLFADACRHSFYHGHLVRSGSWSGWESDSHMKSRLQDEQLAAAIAARCWASEMAIAERPRRSGFLRDVVGNPFDTSRLEWEERKDGRPTGKVYGVNPRYLTGHARGLALLAYDWRDWSMLPILADALEEAGCPSDVPCPECEDESGYRIYCDYCEGSGRAGRIPHPILAHLRGPGPHCRGCWSLDLVLGRR